MSAIVRRIIYVVSYEALAILFITLGLLALGHGGGGSGLVAVASSTVALMWNFVCTSLFEAWEKRQASQTRTVPRRIAHALGFEGGLVVFLIPVLSWILGISLLDAFVLELGILAFFFVYTFVFAWAFDLVLPPASASGRSGVGEGA
ncbi:PACE efflux transporter [Leucobacter chromiireducens]|uniref:PACE efflux transporter n=1 Tax=Leucobacter chromiireducens subsp. solipictus TaxID=398235 RepID=A0ABS1SFE7_9MICO|nr:PACE efflux transporter [Leucobacter chromiireducens]MBL3679275.1 PACE efflux transporter [Leucobacter chromiireducens subsp. solipictus]